MLASKQGWDLGEFSKIPMDMAVLSLSLVMLGRVALRKRNPDFAQSPQAYITFLRTEPSRIDGRAPYVAYPLRTVETTMEEKRSDEQKADVPYESASARKIAGHASQDQRAFLERILMDGIALQSIKLGDQLGLYVALQEAQVRSADGYVSLDELCDMAKTDRRMTLEWLRLHLKFGLINMKNKRYKMEHAVSSCLLPPSYSNESMTGAFRLATCMMDVSPVMKSFETGTQSLFTPEEVPDVKFTENLSDSTKVENRIRFARESFSAKFFRDKFVEHVLLNLENGPELIHQLENGEVDVAEAFCAATSGTLTITMAARFRNTRFFGFETSHVSLSRSRDLAKAADTKNARFYDIKERSLSFGPPPSLTRRHKVRSGFGLVLTFLTMSMIDYEAQEALFLEVRAGLDPELGSWVIMDLDPDQDDLAFALCSGMALLHFLPSLESPQDCAPFSAARCEELARKTGFTSVKQLPTVKDDMLVRLRVFVLK